MIVVGVVVNENIDLVCITFHFNVDPTRCKLKSSDKGIVNSLSV